MRKFLLFVLLLQSCTVLNESSPKSEAKTEIFDDNTLLSCGYDSYDEAQKEAYYMALDADSTQNIKSRFRSHCLSGSLNDACIDEFDVTTVMNDSKFVDVKQVGNCYAFKFKKTKKLTKKESADHNSLFQNSHSIKGESIVRLNIVNSTTLVKTNIDGSDYWINGQKDFEFIGPKKLTVKITDDRYLPETFSIDIPKHPVIITKNISLVLNPEKKAKKKTVGKGFVRYDKEPQNAESDEDQYRFIILKNKSEIDASKTSRKSKHTKLSAEEILSGATIGVEITKSEDDSRTIILSSNKVYNHLPEGVLIDKSMCVDSKLVVTLYGEEYSKIVTLRYPFNSCVDEDGTMSHNVIGAFEFDGSHCEFNTDYELPCDDYTKPPPKYGPYGPFPGSFHHFVARHSRKLTSVWNKSYTNMKKSFCYYYSECRGLNSKTPLEEINASSVINGKFRVTKVEMSFQSGKPKSW